MINGFDINGAREYTFLTGDINGPTLVWDQHPLAVTVSAPTWTIVEAPNAPTWTVVEAPNSPTWNNP